MWSFVHNLSQHYQAPFTSVSNPRQKPSRLGPDYYQTGTRLREDSDMFPIGDEQIGMILDSRGKDYNMTGTRPCMDVGQYNEVGIAIVI
ncbi:hypothetical protein Pmani_023967 [Petrolisthes manimaculis]|uniref:Uncharacterized protein n=1 Tax=Petrolisthes manimaculis TaxID=1843537 RepID=A0AAE1P8S6_9EUCA|nr:hypothetical protein Pmani_023967 [Petrolisthes manimaculis]